MAGYLLGKTPLGMCLSHAEVYRYAVKSATRADEKSGLWRVPLEQRAWGGLHVRTNGSVRGARASASQQNLGFLSPAWLTSIISPRASRFLNAPVATYRCVASLSLLPEHVVGIARTRGHVAQKPPVRCWLLSRGV